MEPEDIENNRLEFNRRKEAIRWAFDVVTMSGEIDFTKDEFWNTVREVENFLKDGRTPENEALASDG